MTTSRIITAEQVAILLNCAESTFRAKRLDLERQHNFPPKMPGCNGWSKPAISRWIETNGETYLPKSPNEAAVLKQAADALSREYAGGSAQ